MVQPLPRRKQILALSGGGFRGLYSARFLEQCETAWGATCAQRFGLIAGTSIGALLAAGLACGKGAGELATTIQNSGPAIFKRRRLHWTRRVLAGAPYLTEPLRAAIVATLGEADAARSLAAIDHPLLIVAVNYSTGSAQLFISKGLAGSANAASNVPLREAVLASAAAPTFFPMIRIGQNDFADGGLIANAPDVAALTEAMARLNFRLEETYMLSIGTAARREGAAIGPKPRNPGVFGWFFRRGLVQMGMAAQETLALRQIATLMNAHHLRIDNEPLQSQVKSIKSMDRATPAAIRTLTSLAERSWEQHRESLALRDFFER